MSTCGLVLFDFLWIVWFLKLELVLFFRFMNGCIRSIGRAAAVVHLCIWRPILPVLMAASLLLRLLLL